MQLRLAGNESRKASHIFADVAQMVAQLICIQWVGGSSPLVSSTENQGAFWFLAYNPAFGLPHRRKRELGANKVLTVKVRIAAEVGSNGGASGAATYRIGRKNRHDLLSTIYARAAK